MNLNGPIKHPYRHLKRSSAWTIVTTATAAVALAGSFVVSTSASTERPSPSATEKPVALTVTAVGAQLRQWPRIVEGDGPIAAWDEASIGTVVGGLRIVQLSANVGDVVVKGAVIARFDTEGLRAEEAELEAGLAQATTEAARAKADFARARLLRGGGGLSEQDALQYQTRSEATAASVDASAARLAGKRWQLKEAVLRAPDGGVISSRSASTGQVSTPGQELFRLIRLQRLEWRGELSAASLAEVQAGQTVWLSLPDGSTASAWIRQLAPAMNPSTRLGTVYADIGTASHAAPAGKPRPASSCWRGRHSSFPPPAS